MPNFSQDFAVISPTTVTRAVYTVSKTKTVSRELVLTQNCVTRVCEEKPDAQEKLDLPQTSGESPPTTPPVPELGLAVSQATQTALSSQASK